MIWNVNTSFIIFKTIQHINETHKGNRNWFPVNQQDARQVIKLSPLRLCDAVTSEIFNPNSVLCAQLPYSIWLIVLALGFNFISVDPRLTVFSWKRGDWCNRYDSYHIYMKCVLKDWMVQVKDKLVQFSKLHLLIVFSWPKSFWCSLKFNQDLFLRVLLKICKHCFKISFLSLIELDVIANERCYIL